ncbi:MAG: hypothetical protein ABH848_04950 [Candidatus Omnitrophota bacterium]
MIKRSWIISFLIVALISLGMFSLRSFGKDEQGKKEENIAVSEKIDEILRNQRDIVNRLNDLRQQLDIIRIRASKN